MGALGVQRRSQGLKTQSEITVMHKLTKELLAGLVARPGTICELVINRPLKELATVFTDCEALHRAK